MIEATDPQIGGLVDGLSAEDLVIAKLEWSVLGDPELQRRYLVQLLEGVGPALDRAYVEEWVLQLGLESAWRTVLERLGS